MFSKEKIQVLEKAYKEGALSMDFAMQIYSYRSSASRGVKDLEENDFLKKVQPPPISQYNKLWIITEKGEAIIDIE